MPDTAPIISAPSQPVPSLKTRISYDSGSYLFQIGLVVLIASLLAGGGMFLFRTQAANAEKQWTQNIEDQKKKMKSEDITKLFEYSAGLAVGKDLVANHIYSSELFDFLRENTHPRVQFSNFAFVRNTAKIELSGLAATYQAVSEQVTLLEANPHIDRVQFGGLAGGEGNTIAFRLTITIKPALLAGFTAANTASSTSAGATPPLPPATPSSMLP
jgi:hypothetical protein